MLVFRRSKLLPWSKLPVRHAVLMVTVLLDDVLLVVVSILDDYSALFTAILHLQANPRVVADPPLAISLGSVPDLLDSAIRGVVGAAYT